MEPRTASFAELKLGDKALFKRMISQNDILKFAELTGDFNPLHIDDAYAAATPFKRTIPHGMLISSFFSTLVGMYLPGKNCLYLAQTVHFKRPAPINEEITISGEIITKIDSLKMLVLVTKVFDKENNLLIEGEAKVKVLL